MRQGKKWPGDISENEDKESSPKGKTKHFLWQALYSSGLHMCPDACHLLILLLLLFFIEKTKGRDT